jgi:hypothetical protein
MYVDLFYAPLQVMVATVRCEEIGNEKVGSFTSDEVIIIHMTHDLWIIDSFNNSFYIISV